MVLGAHVVLCETEPDFLKIFFCPKNEPKIRFYEFTGKLSHCFFLNVVYAERLCLFYHCTNPIFDKNLVHEIWTKMLLAYQIAWFLNQIHIF